MTFKDSAGKMLAVALTEIRFGPCNINLETKYAALIPPRFLLQCINKASEEADNMLNGSVLFLPDVDTGKSYFLCQRILELLET